MYLNLSINTFWNRHMFSQVDGAEFKQLNLLTMPNGQLTDDIAWRQMWSRASQATISFYSIAHYYDAKIDYENEPEYHHFHCGNPDCVYCELITNAKDNGHYESEFISYARFVEKWPSESDAELDYQDLYTFRDRDEEESDEDEDESSYDEDYDSYDEDYDEDESNNYHGYRQADKVADEHFAEVDNGWIAPNGTFYYVPDYQRHNGNSHWETAIKLGFGQASYGFDPVTAAEEAGWIHVSRYYNDRQRFHFVPRNPTVAQKDTAMVYAQATGTRLPDSLKQEMGIKEKTDHRIDTFIFWKRLEDSCMPRSFRDRFYPLSGD
jgi:hypothetical protein